MISGMKDVGSVAFVLRSISGDIDIPVFLLTGNTENNIFIDNGSGKHRKLLSWDSCNLTEEQKEAIVGTHSFGTLKKKKSY